MHEFDYIDALLNRLRERVRAGEIHHPVVAYAALVEVQELNDQARAAGEAGNYEAVNRLRVETLAAMDRAEAVLRSRKA